MLKANSVRLRKKAGKKRRHHSPDKITAVESSIIVPQLAKGACTPSPRKLRNASAKMALGMV